MAHGQTFSAIQVTEKPKKCPGFLNIEENIHKTVNTLLNRKGEAASDSFTQQTLTKMKDEEGEPLGTIDLEQKQISLGTDKIQCGNSESHTLEVLYRFSQIRDQWLPLSHTEVSQPQRQVFESQVDIHLNNPSLA